MTYVTTTYRPVEAHRTRSGKCPVCGRRTKRSHTATMTISPFNKNPDGSVRTSAEVRKAVEAEADAWVPDFRHWDCRDDSMNN